MEDKLLRTKQVSEQFNLPKGTVYTLVARRQIPFLRLGPRLLRFSSMALNQWANDRTFSTKVALNGAKP